jgi:DNA helicase-2/ATP-dependent DNA helicase PcrA
MFNYGNANDAQRKAISTTHGPLLITAGPGTGKTFTLVKRAIYLIQKCSVKPEEILMATFTEKAAKELVTRITNELAECNMEVNLNDMYIGTFHSICSRIIAENIDYTNLRQNYRTLDGFEQSYFIYKNYKKVFARIDDIDTVIDQQRRMGQWVKSTKICTIVNQLNEEMVAVDALKNDTDKQISTIGVILEEYRTLLAQNNLIDFATLQTTAYDILSRNEGVLADIRSRIRYLMIDEYQDTNYIQEELIFLLAGAEQNICVVGDDDQGLYRFRGATIRNILEFRDNPKFNGRKVNQVQLTVNYRSDSDIVNFYNHWMGSVTQFNWGKFRIPKVIESYQANRSIHSPAVIKLSGDDSVGNWHDRICDFLKKLKKSRKITDYNQVAFLFNSVKNADVKALADAMEDSGIPVYSPRSKQFFDRPEIRHAIGILMLLLPEYAEKLAGGKYKEYFIGDFYVDNLAATRQWLNESGNAKLKRWVEERARMHQLMEENATTDYAFTGLLYEMFGYEPFRSILDTDLKVGTVADLRPLRNLAFFTQLVGKYERLEGVEILHGGGRQLKDAEYFFNNYLRLLTKEGVDEFEDETEYAPPGCVSFMTIHQAKGMEFPIVFVDSLKDVPRQVHTSETMNTIAKRYFKRQAFEPTDQIKFFDFWRRYYTAFSRAQNLLVLTCNEHRGKGRGDHNVPSKYFQDSYNRLIAHDDPRFKVEEFTFAQVKESDIKETYSFTSHIAVYQACPMQYKFFRELGFHAVRTGAMLFGTLVHQTIEEVHKAALRGDNAQITASNVEKWFNENYTVLSMAEHSYLSQPQRNAALAQVQRYVDCQRGNWEHIKQAEVDVSLVKPDYIIDGKIDLLRGEGDSVYIIDFKAEQKPKTETDARVERYRQQLQIYADLLTKKGYDVCGMQLYYTGTVNNDNPIIAFANKPEDVEKTMLVFDETVHRIKEKDFNDCAGKSAGICQNCDFRHFCKGK